MPLKDTMGDLAGMFDVLRVEARPAANPLGWALAPLNALPPKRGMSPIEHEAASFAPREHYRL